MTLLSNAEIDTQLKTLEGWTREGDAIRKQYTFRDFLRVGTPLTLIYIVVCVGFISWFYNII